MPYPFHHEHLIFSRYLILISIIFFTNFSSICQGQIPNLPTVIPNLPTPVIVPISGSFESPRSIAVDSPLFPTAEGGNSKVSQALQTSKVTPTATPCLSICENTLAKWKARVDAEEVKTLNDCQRLRDENEIYALEKCCSVPDCIDVPKNVVIAHNYCNAILHEYSVSAQPSKSYTNVEITHPSETSGVLIGSNGPETSNKPKKSEIPGESNGEEEPSKARKLGRSQVIGISMALSITVLAAAAIGVLLLRRKRKLLATMPDLPLPYPGMRSEGDFRPEMLGGSNKFPAEMSAVRSPVEIETTTEHTNSCAELEGQIPEGLQNAQCPKNK